jgi:hypothetical protein
MDPYEILGISPAYEGDLRAVRNLLVKRYFEAGETPDEERMKAINLAYDALRDVHVPARRRVVFRGGSGSSFVLDGQRFVIARRPREPAAIAAPVLASGLVVLAFGWVGAALVAVVWALVQYQRVHRHRRGHRA